MYYANKVQKNFNDNKNDIIELFIEHYGEEYRQLITQKINNTYIDFTSHPLTTYAYAKENNELDTVTYQNAQTFQNINNQCNQKLFEEIKILFKTIFPNISPENINEELIKTFLINEKQPFIDLFSSEYEEILKNPQTPMTTKLSINEARQQIINVAKDAGFRMGNLNPVDVDKFIKARTLLIQEIQKEKVQAIPTLNKLKTDLSTKIGENDISSQANLLFDFALKEEPYHYQLENISIFNKEKPDFYTLIKMPIASLAKKGINSIDVFIINKLIQAIEGNGKKAGFRKYNENDPNTMAYEARTENLALKLAQKLHNNGIYIADNERTIVKSHTIANELFAYSAEFFDQYEKVFSESAINNKPELLTEKFGEAWNKFARYLDQKLKSILANQKKGIPNPNVMDQECIELIGQMCYNYSQNANLDMNVN